MKTIKKSLKIKNKSDTSNMLLQKMCIAISRGKIAGHTEEKL